VAAKDAKGMKIQCENKHLLITCKKPMMPFSVEECRLLSFMVSSPAHSDGLTHPTINAYKAFAS
jgi:hypothetical protein